MAVVPAALRGGSGRRAAQGRYGLSVARSCPPSRGWRNRGPRGGALATNAIDGNTLLVIGAAVMGIGAGIGIPLFYSVQSDKSATRENVQPCFECSGTGVNECRFCLGKGYVQSFSTESPDATEVCVNCEGKGYITCTTCNGSGIQPRYLDRREFVDDD